MSSPRFSDLASTIEGSLEPAHMLSQIHSYHFQRMPSKLSVRFITQRYVLGFLISTWTSLITLLLRILPFMRRCSKTLLRSFVIHSGRGSNSLLNNAEISVCASYSSLSSDSTPWSRTSSNSDTSDCSNGHGQGTRSENDSFGSIEVPNNK